MPFCYFKNINSEAHPYDIGKIPWDQIWIYSKNLFTLIRPPHILQRKTLKLLQCDNKASTRLIRKNLATNLRKTRHTWSFILKHQAYTTQLVTTKSTSRHSSQQPHCSSSLAVSSSFSSPFASSPADVDAPCDVAMAMTSPGGGWSNLHVTPYLQVPVFK